ncbi:MAG: oligosaccharide flippase family protein [Bacteroidota bacterium]
MQKKFFGNLILIIVLNLLVKPFYLFAIDAQVQNTVGAEDYGIYFSLLNFSFLFNIVLDIGINNYNTKNIAQHPNTVAKYIGPILGLRFILGGMYFALSIGLALLLGYDNFQIHLLSLLVFNQFLAGLVLYLRSNFAGLHLFKIDAILSVLDRLLLIIICLVLLYSSWVETPFKIEWFVYAQTITYSITVIVALVLSYVKIGRVQFAFRQLFSRALLKQSTPYALLILLMMLYTRMDAVMIERILPDGKEQAGIYAQGFRLLDAVNMFAFLVAGLLLPIFARQIKQRESVKPILNSAALLLVGTALVVAITSSQSAITLMEMIYNQEIAAAGHSFRWIILSFIPMAASHVFGTLLTANGNLKLLNRMALVGIAVNFTANLIFIPMFKAEGAAFATLGTQSLTALIQILLVLRVFQLNVHYKHLAKIGLLLVALLAGSHYILLWNNNVPGFFATVLVGTAALFLFRIVDIRTIVRLLREKV